MLIINHMIIKRSETIYRFILSTHYNLQIIYTHEKSMRTSVCMYKYVSMLTSTNINSYLIIYTRTHTRAHTDYSVGYPNRQVCQHSVTRAESISPLIDSI